MRVIVMSVGKTSASMSEVIERIRPEATMMLAADKVDDVAEVMDAVAEELCRSRREALKAGK